MGSRGKVGRGGQDEIDEDSRRDNYLVVVIGYFLSSFSLPSLPLLCLHLTASPCVSLHFIFHWHRLLYYFTSHLYTLNHGSWSNRRG